MLVVVVGKKMTTLHSKQYDVALAVVQGPRHAWGAGFTHNRLPPNEYGYTCIVLVLTAAKNRWLDVMAYAAAKAWEVPDARAAGTAVAG